MAQYQKFSRFFRKGRASREPESSARRAPAQLLQMLRDGPLPIAEIVSRGGLDYRELLAGVDVAKELGLIQVEGDDAPQVRLTRAGRMALEGRADDG